MRPTGAIVLLLSVMVNCAVAGSKYGGCWVTGDIFTITPELATEDYHKRKPDLTGGILFQKRLWTVVDSLTALDSMWTRGVGLYYSPDSAGSDTTALYLGQFMGSTVYVDVFFVGTSGLDSISLTVEQAYAFHPPASDSAANHGSNMQFNHGFFTTDTLFKDSLIYDTDIFRVSSSADAGSISRHWRDKFTLTAPWLRFKYVNRRTIGGQNGKPIHIQILVNMPAELLSGAAGRYNRQVK